MSFHAKFVAQTTAAAIAKLDTIVMPDSARTVIVEAVNACADLVDEKPAAVLVEVVGHIAQAPSYPSSNMTMTVYPIELATAPAAE